MSSRALNSIRSQPPELIRKKDLTVAPFVWYINYVVSLRILGYEWKHIIGDCTDCYNGIHCIRGGA